MHRPKYLQKIQEFINSSNADTVFIPSDFYDITDPAKVSMCLTRIAINSGVKRIMRGLYVKPGNTRLCANTLAQAIARNYGWTIIPSEKTALYKSGITSIAPTTWTYVSDGMYRKFSINGITIVFKHTDNKRELTEVSYQTALYIQALRAIGQSNITTDVISDLAKNVNKNERVKMLFGSQRVTLWVKKCIEKICEESTRYSSYKRTIAAPMVKTMSTSTKAVPTTATSANAVPAATAAMATLTVGTSTVGTATVGTSTARTATAAATTTVVTATARTATAAATATTAVTISSASDNVHPKSKNVSTLFGFNVRSKSEAMIAASLYMAGIEYSYEKSLFDINGKDFLPDFTIYYKGKEYYWEHLGLLDNTKYAKDWFIKEKWYKANFPGKLITTTEDGDVGTQINTLMREKFKLQDCTVPDRHVTKKIRFHTQ